jgi:hypothetical protein
MFVVVVVVAPGVHPAFAVVVDAVVVAIAVVVTDPLARAVVVGVAFRVFVIVAADERRGQRECKEAEAVGQRR